MATCKNCIHCEVCEWRHVPETAEQCVDFKDKSKWAELVHGRWELLRKGGCTSVYECSECHRRVAVSCDESMREGQLMRNHPFCHCGAKMDGKINVRREDHGEE